MSGHTPGRMKAGGASVSIPESEERLALDARFYGGNWRDKKANARRVAACWNALLDCPTDLLEQAVAAGITDVSGGNLFSARLELQRQRDELLASLKRLAAQCARMRLPGAPLSDAEKEAGIAIAKSTGDAA